MTKLIWIALALAAGAALPLQGGINARLGKAAESPYYAALLSFAVGTIALLAYVLATRQTVSWAGVKQLPPQYWAGGLLGAAYVTVVILVFPKLGPGLTFSLVVAGQMTLALVLEHFNILVAQPHPINLARMIGAALIVGGVILMKRF